MRLYFIRHGQSINNALWDETGSNRGRSVDPELTPLGHEQARLLANFILEIDTRARQDGQNGEPKRDFFGITHLYSSLMVRAVETGMHLSETLGLPLTAWPEIHETGGIFQESEEGEAIGLPGKPRSFFEKHYPSLVLPESVTEFGWWNRPFEVDEMRPLRAKQVVEMLLERHGLTNDRVAIVSHGGFYVELFRVLFSVGNPQCWFLMQNTAVSCFDFNDDGEVTLIYHNRTDHLPEERLIT